MIREMKTNGEVFKHNTDNNILVVEVTSERKIIYFLNKINRIDVISNDRGGVDLRFCDSSETPLKHGFNNRKEAIKVLDWLIDIFMEITVEPKTTKTKTIAVDVK